MNKKTILAVAVALIVGAVVGVVVSLALWFLGLVAFDELQRSSWGMASLSWPRLESFDPRIVLPLLVSGVVLFLWKRGVVVALLAAAVVSIGQALLPGT